MVALMSQIWAEPLPGNVQDLERVLKTHPGVYKVSTVTIAASGNTDRLIEVDDLTGSLAADRKVLKDLESPLTYLLNRGYLYEYKVGDKAVFGLKPMPAHVWNLAFAQDGRDARKEQLASRQQRAADIEVGKMLGGSLLAVAVMVFLGIVHELRSIRAIRDGSADAKEHGKTRSDLNKSLEKLEGRLQGFERENDAKLQKLEAKLVERFGGKPGVNGRATKPPLPKPEPAGMRKEDLPPKWGEDEPAKNGTTPPPPDTEGGINQVVDDAAKFRAAADEIQSRPFLTLEEQVGV